MDKIVCLGKNYLEHAKELGDTVPEKPVIFIKPPSSLKQADLGAIVRAKLPASRGEVHHECELVFKMGNAQIEAITVGLDMTLRDHQASLKKAGHPWTTAKVFEDAAIIGPWIPLSEFPEWQKTVFSFSLNGALRQQGHAGQMMLSISDALDYIRSFFPLCPGDLIFTGTPKGVGQVSPGSKGKLVFGKIQYEVHWS